MATLDAEFAAILQAPPKAREIEIYESPMGSPKGAAATAGLYRSFLGKDLPGSCSAGTAKRA